MSDVIDLDAKRAEKFRHISGNAICMGCKHEWIAVAPVGTVWLDCPECGCEKGLFRGHCQTADPVLTCDCGNQLHYVTQAGAYCPNCGTTLEV